MKYVLAQQVGSGYFYPIVFANEILHKDMRRIIPDHCKIVGAGEISINEEDGEIKIFGESKSLRMKSNKNDRVIMSLFLSLGLSGLPLHNYILMVHMQQKGTGGIADALSTANIIYPDSQEGKSDEPRS